MENSISLLNSPLRTTTSKTNQSFKMALQPISEVEDMLMTPPPHQEEALQHELEQLNLQQPGQDVDLRDADELLRESPTPAQDLQVVPVSQDHQQRQSEEVGQPIPVHAPETTVASRAQHGLLYVIPVDAPVGYIEAAVTIQSRHSDLSTRRSRRWTFATKLSNPLEEGWYENRACIKYMLHLVTQAMKEHPMLDFLICDGYQVRHNSLAYHTSPNRLQLLRMDQKEWSGLPPPMLCEANSQVAFRHARIEISSTLIPMKEPFKIPKKAAEKPPAIQVPSTVPPPPPVVVEDNRPTNPAQVHQARGAVQLPNHEAPYSRGMERPWRQQPHPRSRQQPQQAMVRPLHHHQQQPRHQQPRRIQQLPKAEYEAYTEKLKADRKRRRTNRKENMRQRLAAGPLPEDTPSQA